MAGISLKGEGIAIFQHRTHGILKAEIIPALLELRSPILPFQAPLSMRSSTIKELAKLACSPVARVVF